MPRDTHGVCSSYARGLSTILHPTKIGSRSCQRRDRHSISPCRTWMDRHDPDVPTGEASARRLAVEVDPLVISRPSPWEDQGVSPGAGTDGYQPYPKEPFPAPDSRGRGR